MILFPGRPSQRDLLPGKSAAEPREPPSSGAFRVDTSRTRARRSPTPRRLRRERRAALTPHRGSDVRSRIDHPVFDGDGHLLEFEPHLTVFLREVGGSKMAADSRAQFARVMRWYGQSPEERRQRRTVRPPWGLHSKNTL